MKIITKKSEIKTLLQKCLAAYDSDGPSKCLSELNSLILSNKVKFPLLEYCAEQFYLYLPKSEHIQFCDEVQSLKTEGGNVILGIMLQKRWEDGYAESIDKAVEYIADADMWYVCDIIGERVFGHALLSQPELTISEIKRLSNHPSNWVIRSLGAGIHYAIKKGLAKKHVKTTFKILLSMANTTDKEIRQGVGWAAKTTAKFHPELIEHFQGAIDDPYKVANWFRTKISIGLKRHEHAPGN